MAAKYNFVNFDDIKQIFNKIFDFFFTKKLYVKESLQLKDKEFFKINLDNEKEIDLSNFKLLGLDVDEIGGNNKYIKSVKQTEGKISAEVGEITNEVSADNNNLITSNGVFNFIDNVKNELHDEIDSIEDIYVKKDGGLITGDIEQNGNLTLDGNQNITGNSIINGALTIGELE